jgi:hypothetical protein
MKNNRREFIKTSSMAGLALVATPVGNKLGSKIISDNMEKKIKFLKPVDGDILTSYDGIQTEKGLLTEVTVTAPTGMEISINGTTAGYSDGKYSAKVNITGYNNIFEAKDAATGKKAEAEIFWLKNVVDKYRLSIDDNIWFLRDINKNAGIYKSIFENQYLGFLKGVHDTYGTKIHLNLFYETDGFNLSQMTDKFKGEWKDNADWLHLSFHAISEFPDRLYKDASYEQVKHDCILVRDQIKRFAGEELMGPVTTLHWGAATADGCRALRDQGYRALAGYFSAEGQDTVSYYLNDEKRLHVNNRFLWRDNTEGLIFSRLALVINTVGLNEIVPYLDNLKSDGHKPAFCDLMIHEQYFYPFYSAYQPDFRDKVITAVKWAVGKGYIPAFLSDCLFS